MTPKDFLDKFYSFAVAAETSTGISRWVTLAQCALESGWGEKQSGKNNLFGIKSFSQHEPRELVTTFEYSKRGDLQPLQIGLVKIDAVVPSQSNPGYFKYTGQAWFRSFETPEQAFEAHGQVFLKNPRYKVALVTKADAEAFTRMIAPIYAQSPTYADTVISIMKTLKKL